MGIEIRSVIGGDEASPFGAVISGIAVVQAGFGIVVVTTVTDGVGVCYGNVGSIAGDGAIAPGIVDISGDQSTAGVVNAHHIAQRIPVEVVGTGHAADGMLHTDNGIAVTIILPPPLPPVKKKPPRPIRSGWLPSESVVAYGFIAMT